MKKKLSLLVSILFVVQTLLSGMILPVSAEESETITFEVPDSQHQTYNMNLDWRFFETLNGDKNDIWTSMDQAKDASGKAFYENDYNEASLNATAVTNGQTWESVSIPHAINGDNAFTNNISDAGGGGKRGVYLYRKTFTVPASAANGKVFFELEGIRQAAYVWVNGNPLGYYEAGITAFGFDMTEYVKPGETATIAICEDGTTARGTSYRIPYETVPGEKWGSSYTPDNYKTSVGNGQQFQWISKDFNEAQVGLVYDAYLHVTSNVYQTFPLYNNLKTTGNYIYATDFDTRSGSEKATIHVKSEIRNESGNNGNYTLDVAVVDHEGKLAYEFNSASTPVAAATDTDPYAGMTPEEAATAKALSMTAVEKDVYSEQNRANPVGITKVNTPDVSYIETSGVADGIRFWSLDDPYLYTVYTILKDADGNVVDVQSKETGFRKVTYDKNNGILINDKAVWLTGYAQRSTNEWAVVGSASDWLQDYDMSLLKENNANFIRWMHVAPKPAEVRSSDKYGVAVVCPAGDKEADPDGRQWSQRAEAMRDAMIYFRNSPSVLFWETGNNEIAPEKALEMNKLRNEIDPYGMRFMGARSTGKNSSTAPEALNYEYNYAGTMYGNYAENAQTAMDKNGIPGPIMETEYARDESPRRVWDLYSPPDYEYVNKWMGPGKDKADGYDIWNHTQEEAVLANVKEYGNNYYANRAGKGKGYYSAAAMMVWSDSNMHGRNSATENCRTSGRVDPVRQTKEMFYGMQAAQDTEPSIHIVGHWSYPQYGEDTYNYFDTNEVQTTDKDSKGKLVSYYQYDTSKPMKRNPLKKSVYVIGSDKIAKVELYRVDGDKETLIGTCTTPSSTFVYQFDNIDVTQGDAVIAKAYDASGKDTVVATHEIKRTYDAVGLQLKVKSHPDGWRADGSDIAFFDVEVIDKNGNVCALNYDKINFEYSGEGVYLGGYNSGSGTNCFQNNPASTGISKYFGGDKLNLSTIGKDYVYAENGTNRIFVRSTRTAGDFTLTAKMEGLPSASVTIQSKEMTAENGLTTTMQSKLDPGISADRPITSTTPSLKPLMGTSKLIDWANVEIVKDIDTTVYYDVTLNDKPLELNPKAREAINGYVYGPLVPIFDKLINDEKAPISYTYDTAYDGKTPTLTLRVGEHTYSYVDGHNVLYIDGFHETSLTEQQPEIVDGIMMGQFSSMLSCIPGLDYTTDTANHVFKITYSAQ